MKIKYLGTAAAEGIPALFCECDICRVARETKGKNVRSRSQMLVNDDLLIDYPPDSFFHFVNHNVDFSKIHNVLISHAHEDHFYPLDFEYFLKGYSMPINCLPFTINGSIDLKSKLECYINNERNPGLAFRELQPFVTERIGHYFVTPLKASHGTEHPYLYLVSDGVKTLFYCHDTGLLKEEAFTFLADKKIHVDLISIDCNYGDSDSDCSHHMSTDAVRKTIAKLKDIRVLDDTSKIVVNHFSHNGGHVLYDDMCKIVHHDGFLVSYDGLEIEF